MGVGRGRGEQGPRRFYLGVAGAVAARGAHTAGASISPMGQEHREGLNVPTHPWALLAPPRSPQMGKAGPKPEAS